jgi:hypothetical protein
MKTLKKLLLLVVVTGSIFSCAKDDHSDFDISGLGKDHNCFPAPINKVFMVKPNGTDDTENLIQAFTLARNAGPGSVVKLTEGEFKIGFIEIREFYGSFAGDGKGKTVITAKTGLDCTGFESQGLWTYLINFVGGNIIMSDMTLRIPDETICAEGQGFTGLVIFADITNNYTSLKKSVKTIVNNVEFTGIKYGPWWYNCWNALAGGQNTKVASGLIRSDVDMIITNCTFDAFAYGTQMFGVKKGRFILGAKNQGNIFSNCAESVILYDVINLPVEVADNKFNTSDFGLDFENTPMGAYIAELPVKRTLINFEGNEFNVSYTGVRIFDGRRTLVPGEDYPVKVMLKNNRIVMNNGMMGIHLFNLKDALVHYNLFTGTGQQGIRVRTRPPDGTVCSENGLILWNDFSKAVFSVDAVVLEPYTKNWKIIGADLEGNVTDLGENNTIKNMKKNHPETPSEQWNFENN